jgi:peptidyl-prolyl isomerase E (cyclophilin E)
MDYAVGKHRGFAFVEYNDPDDAVEAIFNMNGSDLLGRTLRVTVAQPNQLHKLGAGGGGSIGDGKKSSLPGSQQAVWSNDEWFQQHVGGGGGGTTNEQSKEEQKLQRNDQQILTEAMTS